MAKRLLFFSFFQTANLSAARPNAPLCFPPGAAETTCPTFLITPRSGAVDLRSDVWLSQSGLPRQWPGHPVHPFTPPPPPPPPDPGDLLLNEVQIVLMESAAVSLLTPLHNTGATFPLI